MWPWEHVMVGYLLYSLYARLRYGRPPGDRAALVVVAGALLPDLIDKPLAWWLSVLPAGRSLGHSLPFAIPLVIVVWALARRLGAPDLGPAFAVPYLAHLPADAIYPALLGEELSFGFLLYPIVPIPDGGETVAVAHLTELVVDFAAFVASPGGWRFVAVEATLVALTLAFWLLDGKPGVGTIRAAAGPRR